MEYDQEKYPEPPELRSAGIPPLLKIIKTIVVVIAIAFVIVMAFAVAFRLNYG